MARFQRYDSRQTRVSSIEVRLTVDEAIVIIRAVSAQRWREADAEKRDDLELLRLKLYDVLPRTQADVITLRRCA
jgi:hypothetical protein